MSKKLSKNIRTVLEILRDEIRGDVRAAMRKLDDKYSMTWVYKSPKSGKLFPRTKKSTREELIDVYHIKHRTYDIKHIAENNNVVFVEMTESYPDSKTKKMYRTPLVLVLEMKNGKIKTGRHYCDPQLSYLHLSKQQIDKAFK